MRIIYKVVGTLVIFVVGSIIVKISNEIFGGMIPALIASGLGLFLIWFWGLWDKWFKRKSSS